LGGDLVSAVLYGSAAEGRLRATSDVNLILVLRGYDAAGAKRLGPALTAARAAVRLQVMFLLEEELGHAMEAFPVKFADIAARRRIIFGDDPFAGREPSRRAMAEHLRQMLLNVTIRLRQDLARRGRHDDELALVAAETAGPLRAASAALMRVWGRAAASPKEALESVVGESGNQGWMRAMEQLSRARETRAVAAGEAGRTAGALLEIASYLRRKALEVEA